MSDFETDHWSSVMDKERSVDASTPQCSSDEPAPKKQYGVWSIRSGRGLMLHDEGWQRGADDKVLTFDTFGEADQHAKETQRAMQSPHLRYEARQIS
jgi:hypothetical protein